jgi:hypothetical protein
MPSEDKMKMFVAGYQEAEKKDKTEYIYVRGWKY